LAVNAGMQRVGCLWGFRDRDELMAAGAQWVIATPLELLAP
jgi:phosphoglycolate phosphatase-like HAD superfamily hydrolase